MGLLDRFGDLVTGAATRTWDTASGLTEAAWQAPAFLYDISIGAAVGDDDYEGFVDTFLGSFEDRLGNLFEAGFSSESGFGAAIGGLPELVRSPARTTVNTIDDIYMAGIDRPLSTLVTMSSIASVNGWDEFFNPGSWSTAYKIADARSLGESIAIAVGTKDIFDEEEVAEFMDTSFFRTSSLVLNLVAGVKYDPAALAGRGLSVLRNTPGGLRLRGTNITIGPPGSKLARHSRVGVASPKPGLISQLLFDVDPDGIRELARLESYTDLGRAVGAVRRSGVEATKVTKSRLARGLLRVVPEDIPYLDIAHALIKYPKLRSNWRTSWFRALDARIHSAGAGNLTKTREAWLNGREFQLIKDDIPNLVAQVRAAHNLPYGADLTVAAIDDLTTRVGVRYLGDSKRVDGINTAKMMLADAIVRSPLDEAGRIADDFLLKEAFRGMTGDMNALNRVLDRIYISQRNRSFLDQEIQDLYISFDRLNNYIQNRLPQHWIKQGFSEDLAIQISQSFDSFPDEIFQEAIDSFRQGTFHPDVTPRHLSKGSFSDEAVHGRMIQDLEDLRRTVNRFEKKLNTAEGNYQNLLEEADHLRTQFHAARERAMEMERLRDQFRASQPGHAALAQRSIDDLHTRTPAERRALEQGRETFNRRMGAREGHVTRAAREELAALNDLNMATRRADDISNPFEQLDIRAEKTFFEKADPEKFNQNRLEALSREAKTLRYNETFFTKAEEIGVNVDDPVPAALLDYFPSMRVVNRANYAWTYQAGPLAKPFKVFTNMVPGHFIDLSLQKSDEQMERLARDVYMPKGVRGLTKEDLQEAQAKISAWRGRMARARSITERKAIFHAFEEEAVRHLARQYGLTENEIDIILKYRTLGRAVSDHAIRSAAAPKGRSLYSSVIIEGDTEILKFPQLLSQTEKVVAPVNWRLLRRELSRYRRKRARWKGVLEDTDWMSGASRETRYKVQDLVGEGGVVPEATVKEIVDQTNFLTSTGKLAHSGLEDIMKVWTPLVLLRPAWTLRVVLMDEQLRRLVQFGGLVSFHSQIAQTGTGIRNTMVDFAESNNLFSRGLGLSKHVEESTAWKRRAALGALVGAGMTTEDEPIVGALVGGFAGVKLGKMMRRLKRAPIDVPISGNKYAQAWAFGPTDDVGDFQRAMVSSRQHDQITRLAGLEGPLESRLRQIAARRGGFKVVQPDDANKWKQAADQAINRQLANSPVGRIIAGKIADRLDDGAVNVLDNDTLDDIAASLADWVSSPAGKDYVEEVGLHSRVFSPEAIEEWSDSVVAEVYTYLSIVGESGITYADPALFRRLSEGRHIDVEKLWNSVADKRTLPPIHGAQLAETLGGPDTLVQFYNRMIADAFDMFARFPTDNINRQPAFANFFQLEYRRQANVFSDGGRITLNESQLRQIERSARRRALQETRDLLYELAERSQFGEMSRLIMPFFPAWQEVLTRYVGLAYEKPEYVGRLAAIWNGDYWQTDPETGEEYIQIGIPEWAKGLASHGVFKGVFDDLSEVTFTKSQLNMITQGLPGFGPLVQFPISQAIANNPKLEETVQFMFPYGHPDDIWDSFLPATGRRLRSFFEGPDNRAFHAAASQILITRLVEMEEGKRPMLDFEDPAIRDKFMADVINDTKRFMMMRTVAGAIAPTTPLFNSPYQEYIRLFHQMRNIYGPEEAELRFLQTFGEEYFALTQSTTKLNNGVPPTGWGITQEEKFGDIIMEHPDFGSVVVGTDGGGEAVKFVRAKYDQQLRTPLRTGGFTKQRERYSLDEMITSQSNRLAWSKFSRFMDGLEARRKEEGLPNLLVKDAEHLLQAKRLFVEDLAKEFPSWRDDYLNVDRGAFDRKIEAFRDFADYPGLGTPDEEGNVREDLAPLNDYFEMRDLVMGILQLRKEQGGSGTLIARENQDIAVLWESFISNLLSENPMFADLFYRYLDNDQLRQPLLESSNV